MKVLAYFLAFYFFVLSLAPNMQGAQVLNLPTFVSHFQQHQQRNPGASLVSFVKEHYFSRLNEFEKEHKNLPFKSVIPIAVGACIVEKYTVFPAEWEQVVFSEKSDKIITQNENCLSPSFYSVWNPPKSC